MRSPPGAESFAAGGPLPDQAGQCRSCGLHPASASNASSASRGWSSGLSQVAGIALSERVALRLPLPGIVVIWFVTDYSPPYSSSKGIEHESC